MTETISGAYPATWKLASFSTTDLDEFEQTVTSLALTVDTGLILVVAGYASHQTDIQQVGCRYQATVIEGSITLASYYIRRDSKILL